MRPLSHIQRAVFCRRGPCGVIGPIRAIRARRISCGVERVITGTPAGASKRGKASNRVRTARTPSSSHGQLRAHVPPPLERRADDGVHDAALSRHVSIVVPTRVVVDGDGGGSDADARDRGWDEDRSIFGLSHPRPPWRPDSKPRAFYENAQ